MSAPADGRQVRPRPAWRDVDGILLLDKPVGMSSNAALQQVRRIFRARKAGHTGSLDPLATGLLPVCFGQATKISGLLLDADKRYVVEAALGARTTTGDAEGEVVERLPVPPLDAAAVEHVLEGFRGEVTQVPPMYSALKHQGQRLYELARDGVEVPREPRVVAIHSLLLTGLGPDSIALDVTCSKGTYIRTLVEDVAIALGTCAHVRYLRRLDVGPFAGRALYHVEDLEAAASRGDDALDGLLLPPDSALAGWPAVTLGGVEEAYVLQGQAVFVRGPAGERVRMYGQGGRFLGVGQMTGEGFRLAPTRLMVSVAAPGVA
jgi:tRNA pseudouridine55 synthase